MYSIPLLSGNMPPLAERIRPQILSDFIGQDDIIDSDGIIGRAISNNQPFSLILYGPPGTGKTSLARILSKEFSALFFELSATSNGVKEIREIIKKGDVSLANGKKTILFIDEIHRFSKMQQDSLLHAVEQGKIILIGATTENPSFEIISALLSRCQILKLRPIINVHLIKILKRALKEDIILSKSSLEITDDILSYTVDSCGGDARKMLNTFELAVSMMPKGEYKMDIKNIQKAQKQKNIIYDKSGDFHYDVVSAFIKSVRGSDPDAAIYWLAVMLEGGESPEFIARRLIILASEDIGNAEPYALQLATSAFDAIRKIGMPEGRIVLSQITTYLAASPKSNSAYLAINTATDFIKNHGVSAVPLHLRNASTAYMKDENYGKNYKYPHDYSDHFVEQDYFPESFNKSLRFYQPGNEGREKFLKQRLEKIWSARYK